MPSRRIWPIFLVAALIISPLARSQEQKPKPQRPTPQDIEKITAALPETALARPKQARKVLIYTKATGFVHSSIPVGAKTFDLMGQKTGAFSTVISDDPEAFAAEHLKQFDAVVLMSTTGSLFVPKNANEGLLRDTSKPLPPDLQHAKELRDSLLAFVKE